MASEISSSGGKIIFLSALLNRPRIQSDMSVMDKNGRHGRHETIA